MKIGKSDKERQLLTVVLRDIRARCWTSLSEQHREIIETYVKHQSLSSVATLLNLSISGVKRIIERLLGRHTDWEPAIGLSIHRRGEERPRISNETNPLDDLVVVRSLLADPTVESVTLCKPGTAVQTWDGLLPFVLDEDGVWQSDPADQEEDTDATG